MKEIQIPQNAEQQQSKTAALRCNRVCASVFTIACAIIAVLSLIGVLVSVIMLEFAGAGKETLFYILIGSFAGGAIFFALFAFLFAKLSRRASDIELDFRERCDGQYSFFVGDGTLATFGEEFLRIHAESGSGTEVKVPYSELRFFSVCTRRRAREKGEWSVVIEVPVKYLKKDGKAEKNAPPALVQADAKARLFARLEELGLSVLGERKGEEKGKKFTPRRKFIFPDAPSRKRAMTSMAFGGVLIIAGVLLAIFWQIAIGAILAVFGAVFAGRGAFNFLRAKRVLTFYDEGVYWRELSIHDSAFLKWEEVESVSRTEHDKMPLLKFKCSYGAYHFPDAPGAFEYLENILPEKVGKV